jgi:hypothetical protein
MSNEPKPINAGGRVRDWVENWHDGAGSGRCAWCGHDGDFPYRELTSLDLRDPRLDDVKRVVGLSSYSYLLLDDHHHWTPLCGECWAIPERVIATASRETGEDWTALFASPA